MTSNQLDDYAAKLASAALVSTNSAADAAGVLLQASLVVMITNVPGGMTIESVEEMAAAAVDSFRDVLQPRGMAQ